MIKRPPQKKSSMRANVDDEDVENSSLVAQAYTAREESSIRGMSDWESNAGVDSTVDGSLMPSRLLRAGDVVTSATADDFDVDDSSSNSRQRSRRSEKRLYRWWFNVISRVSRSASSLLNQHSPNLTDILDGNEENPLATVEERRGCQRSIPEDDVVTCVPIAAERVGESEVFALREEVARLKKRVQELESSSSSIISGNQDNRVALSTPESLSFGAENIPSVTPVMMLEPDQISRYSRQLLLNDGFGVAGQKKLLSTSALVVGAGGIGSTVLLYLAAAGVGHVTIVDYDCVEMSNLHRQIIHKDENSSKNYDQLGMNKAMSAKQSVLALNPTISCTALAVMIDGDNALQLVSEHCIVIDACDNPRTRYLLNDACILAGKPLVSGSAMGTEGQLTVYNYRPDITTPNQSNPRNQNESALACYRCLYPNPVPSEGSKSCSDNGVLGPVPGIIGVLQAVEVLKVVTGIGNIMYDRLMMYDSLHCSFMNIKKPQAKKNCAVCSPGATILSMKDSEQSLENVRGPSACGLPNQQLGKLPSEHNIQCNEYDQIRKNGQPHVLLDVRVTRQFEMCSLEGSINVPLENLEAELGRVGELSNGELPVYCLCRRGIASAEATRIIQKSIDEGNTRLIHSVYNIAGGLSSWVKTVDSKFPQY